jgi:cysteine desulfurase
MTNSPSIYLDYAAATPLDDTVLAAMQPYFSSAFYNPSATYNAAREVKDALEAVRSRVAHWLGAKNSEIIFTAGGSEANNLAIHGIMRTYPKGNIVVSGVEHDSVLSPSEHYTCRKVNMLSDGRVDLVDLKKKIDKQTVLVSIMQANNEVGTIQPIRQISKLVTEIRKSPLKRRSTVIFTYRRLPSGQLPGFTHFQARS